MSVYAIGVDLAEIGRMREMIDHYGERFLQRVFTVQEIEYCSRKKVGSAESFAARFAAKEAVFKAAGTGLTVGMRWHDVEVLNNTHGGRSAAARQNRRHARGPEGAHLPLPHRRYRDCDGGDFLITICVYIISTYMEQ